MKSFEGRVRDLRARVGEHVSDPVLGEAYALVCNGCGATVTARTVHGLVAATGGWVRGAELGTLDYCPECLIRPPGSVS